MRSKLALPRPTMLRDLRALWPAIADKKPWLAGMVVLGFVASFVETLGVSFVVLLLFGAIRGPESIGGDGATAGLLDTIYGVATWVVGDSLIGLAVLIAAAVLIKSLVVGAYSVLAAWVQYTVHHRVREAIYARYMEVAYDDIARQDYGTLANTLIGESWEVSSVVQALSRILINLASMTVYGLFVLALSWPLGLMAAVGGLVVVAVLRLARDRLRRLGRRATGLNEALTESAFSGLQAMRTIRAFGAEAREVARFATVSRRVSRVFVRLTALDHLIRPGTEMLSLVMLGAVIALSFAIGNTTAVTVAVVALLWRLQPQMREIEHNLVTLAGKEYAVGVVARAIDRRGKRFPPEGTVRFEGLREAIVAEDLGYTHPGSSEPTLTGLSFTIPRGETVAVAGPSGAGKSTLVNLLLKLYEPAAGTIRVDGTPLPEIERSSWLARIALTGQDVDLIEGTIAENLRLGSPLAGDAVLRAALAEADILDFVDGLPDGIETRVGERGLRLSGGQRQRLALARALVGEPEILILDEATNAVDAGSETRIMERLRRSRPSLTLIVIAHRGTVLDLADRRIFLEAGRQVPAAGRASAMG
ncbi:MAG: ABC transporter ATP-binding protein [Azospirillaceae bacterium]